MDTLDDVDMEIEAPAKVEEVQMVDAQAATLKASVEVQEQAKGLPILPNDLVTSKAYMMWIENGRPLGANFDPEARNILEQELKKGRRVFIWGNFASSSH
jgi:hypothetical protein